MALNDNAVNFWVAAAAAAPVIALAGVVAITDAPLTGAMLRRAKKRDPTLYGWMTEGHKLGPPYIWVAVYSILNLLMQGFALIAALLALLYGGSPIPGVWIIVVEGLGLFLLLVGTWLTGTAGAERQRLEDARTDAAAEQMAAAIASKFTQLQGASKPEEMGDA